MYLKRSIMSNNRYLVERDLKMIDLCQKCTTMEYYLAFVICWMEIVWRVSTEEPHPWHFRSMVSTCRPGSSSCRRGPRCPSAGRCRPSAHQTPSPAPPPPASPHPWGRWRTRPCCSGTWSTQTEICLNIIIIIIMIMIIIIIVLIIIIIIIIIIITWKSATEATVPSSTIFWVRFLQGKLLVRIAARKLLFIICKYKSTPV